MDLSNVIPGPPEIPHVSSNPTITALTITLSWISGRDGGSKQNFTIYFQKNVEGAMNKTIPNIPDPGIGFEVKHTERGLEPEMMYKFCVEANNEYGTSTNQSCETATTLGNMTRVQK